MLRWGAAFVGVAVGAVAALAVAYLFGPAPESPFDQRYRSRLDDALAEGQRAADAKESELRTRYAQLRTGGGSEGKPAA